MKIGIRQALARSDGYDRSAAGKRSLSEFLMDISLTIRRNSILAGHNSIEDITPAVIGDGLCVCSPDYRLDFLSRHLKRAGSNSAGYRRLSYIQTSQADPRAFQGLTGSSSYHRSLNDGSLARRRSIRLALRHRLWRGLPPGDRPQSQHDKGQTKAILHMLHIRMLRNRTR